MNRHMRTQHSLNTVSAACPVHPQAAHTNAIGASNARIAPTFLLSHTPSSTRTLLSTRYRLQWLSLSLISSPHLLAIELSSSFYIPPWLTRTPCKLLVFIIKSSKLILTFWKWPRNQRQCSETGPKIQQWRRGDIERLGVACVWIETISTGGKNPENLCTRLFVYETATGREKHGI